MNCRSSSERGTSSGGTGEATEMSQLEAAERVGQALAREALTEGASALVGLGRPLIRNIDMLAYRTHQLFEVAESQLAIAAAARAAVAKESETVMSEVSESGSIRTESARSGSTGSFTEAAVERTGPDLLQEIEVGMSRATVAQAQEAMENHRRFSRLNKNLEEELVLLFSIA